MRIGLLVLRWDTHPSSFHEYWPYQNVKPARRRPIEAANDRKGDIWRLCSPISLAD
jgi:hypothetical protein